MSDTLEFRAKAYTRGRTESHGAETLIVSGITTEPESERILAHLTDTGLCSGGHIEQFVQGIGWTLREEAGNPEAEDQWPREIHADLTA